MWGGLREFERDGILSRDLVDIYGGITETMQADVKRLLPRVLGWLHRLEKEL